MNANGSVQMLYLGALFKPFPLKDCGIGRGVTLLSSLLKLICHPGMQKAASQEVSGRSRFISCILGDFTSPLKEAYRK